MSTTGTRIAQLRKEKGFSQAGLAKVVGISREAIGKYERGEASASIETAKKIADAFDVTLDYLVDETGTGTFDKKKQLVGSRSYRAYRRMSKVMYLLSSTLFCGMLRRGWPMQLVKSIYCSAYYLIADLNQKQFLFKVRIILLSVFVMIVF